MLAGYLERIGGDVYYISERIKAIDDGYFIVRNKRLGRFEVHNEKNRGNSYCLAVPYVELDARTLELVLRTRAERARKEFARLERENALLQRENLSKAVKNAENRMENMLSRGESEES